MACKILLLVVHFTEETRLSWTTAKFVIHEYYIFTENPLFKYKEFWCNAYVRGSAYSKTTIFDMKISFSYSKSIQVHKHNTKHQCSRHSFHPDQAGDRVHGLLHGKKYCN